MRYQRFMILFPHSLVRSLAALVPVIALLDASGQTARAAEAPHAHRFAIGEDEYDQGYGCILYRTKLPAGPEASLEAAAIHDVGQVFLDGERIGFTDRRSRNFRVQLPARTQAATLDILVEAMGRVNFGVEVHDRKGIHGPVTLAAGGKAPVNLRGWQIFRLPLDLPMLGGLEFQRANSSGGSTGAPGFWRATVNVDQPGDCFLDMRLWGKGFAWVNGHNLGRYWNFGPQQTMYVPAPWLEAGDNEIIILAFSSPTIWSSNDAATWLGTRTAPEAHRPSEALP